MNAELIKILALGLSLMLAFQMGNIPVAYGLGMAFAYFSIWMRK